MSEICWILVIVIRRIVFVGIADNRERSAEFMTSFLFIRVSCCALFFAFTSLDVFCPFVPVSPGSTGG